jgi:hypothetical protein
VSDETADLRAELEALSAERARLWTELHDQRALEREVDDLRAQVAYMENTASWKLTTPLRLAKRAVHEMKILRASRG